VDNGVDGRDSLIICGGRRDFRTTVAVCGVVVVLSDWSGFMGVGSLGRVKSDLAGMVRGSST